MNSRLFLADEAATIALAEDLARSLPARAVIWLQGDLGAGKSTFARALLRALGVQGAIRSPTYTLVERYPLVSGGEALHLDLYRIGDAGELEFLGLDPEECRLWLVEWPDRGAGALPRADVVLALAIEGSGRSAALTPISEIGKAWVAGIRQPENTLTRPSH